MFSSRRSSFRVPGIGTIYGFWASSQASAMWASVANARMRSIRQFLDHPQLEARDRWREFGSPVGPLRGLLPPAMLDGQEPVMTPIPEVGEHNQKILAELGYESVETTAPGRDGATSTKEA